MTTPFNFTHNRLPGHVDSKGQITYNGSIIPLSTFRTPLRNSIEKGRNAMFGVPETVRFYRKYKSAEPYTVIFMAKPEAWGYEALDSIGQHVIATPGRNLGSRVYFGQLPPELKKIVLQNVN